MKNNSRVIVLTWLVIFMMIVCVGAYFCSAYLKSEEENRKILEFLEQEEIRLIKLEEERIANLEKIAYDGVNALYENDIPRLKITDETINDVQANLLEILDEELKKELSEKLEEIVKFREVEALVNKLLVDGVLVSNYDDDDISDLKAKCEKLNLEWQKVFEDDIGKIDKQKSNILKARKNVKALFSDNNMTKVKTNVTRNMYNTANKSVNGLLQKDLIKEYKPYLEKVLKVVEENEEKARKEKEEKERREAEIKAAWVILKTPYISQTSNKVYNGCEAASLLMGLQYKGYLKGMSLRTYAEAMPKSDNPHEGFVSDIFNLEPRDIPHWIAPDALARYGRNSSGYNGVSDITGASVDYLKKELDKGNPVVVYITGGNFAEPKNFTDEVPVNFHVVLLIGYNPISKQLVVNDPWTKSSDGKIYVSESKFTSIYNAVGKKAVVIR